MRTSLETTLERNGRCTGLEGWASLSGRYAADKPPSCATRRCTGDSAGPEPPISPHAASPQVRPCPSLPGGVAGGGGLLDSRSGKRRRVSSRGRAPRWSLSRLHQPRPAHPGPGGPCPPSGSRVPAHRLRGTGLPRCLPGASTQEATLARCPGIVRRGLHSSWVVLGAPPLPRPPPLPSRPGQRSR